MDDLRFLKHALFGHLELCTGDQRCLNTFHRAVHGGFMDTPVIAQVRKRTVLTPKFQGHQELLSDAECRWAAGFLLPSLSFNQDGLHLGEDLRIHPSASTELLAVHLQRAGQAFLLHPLSLACDFRKRSTESAQKNMTIETIEVARIYLPNEVISQLSQVLQTLVQSEAFKNDES